MKVCLLSRFFDCRTAGLARIANELHSRLVNDGVDVVTFPASSPTLFGYLKYLLYEIPRKAPQADIYHTITPMEAMFTPPNKTVVTVPDLILLLHPECGGSGVGGNRLMQILSSAFTWWGYRRAMRARRLVCISSHAKRLITRIFKVPADKVQVVRLGIREDLKPKEEIGGLYQG